MPKSVNQFPIFQWMQTPLNTYSSTPVESLWSLECHCTGRNSTLPIARPLDSSSWWSNNIWRLTLRKSLTASIGIRKEWKRLCEKRFLIWFGSRTIWYLGVSSPLRRLTCNDSLQVAIGSLAGASVGRLAGPLLDVRIQLFRARPLGLLPSNFSSNTVKILFFLLIWPKYLGFLFWMSLRAWWEHFHL